MHKPQQEYDSIQKEFFLVGGGHANINLIKEFGMRPIDGVRLNLITDVMHAPYTGMLPGYVSKHFDFESSHIDLNRLCTNNNVRLFHSYVEKIQPNEQLIYCNNRPPVKYDYLSLNVGSVQQTKNIKGAEKYALSVKPVNNFLNNISHLIDQIKNFRGIFHLVIAGGGPVGIELAIAIQTRINIEMANMNLIPDTVKVFLCIPNEFVLETFNKKSIENAVEILRKKKIQVLPHARILKIEKDSIQMQDKKTMAADAVILATGSSAPDWFKEMGLQTDELGFVKCRPTLQSFDFENIFIAGDMVSLPGKHIDKSGIYAVRMSKTIIKNIRATHEQKSCSKYIPQKSTMYIMTMDKNHSILNWGSQSFAGKWPKRLKDFIDKKHVKKFSYLDIENDAINYVPNQESMRCGGCGAKVSQPILKAAISGINLKNKTDILSGPNDFQDSSCIKLENGQYLYQTVDYFKTMINDPYLFGKITAYHCINDILASFATPHSALSIVGLPYGNSDIRKIDMTQMLFGLNEVLEEHNTTLIGGHTSESTEFSLGLALNSFSQRAPKKNIGIEDGSIILTGKLGSGCLFASDALGICKGKWKEDMLHEILTSSQKAANIISNEAGAICTDVTGFGLIGSLYQLLANTPQKCQIKMGSLPIFDGAAKLWERGIKSTMGEENKNFSQYISNIEDFQEGNFNEILFDPQTAGPLLAIIPANNAKYCLENLHNSGYHNATIIGNVASCKSGMSVRLMS